MDSYVNRIYGKQKRRKVNLTHQRPKEIPPQDKIETAIFKKMDDIFRNERLSQKETRQKEAEIEREVLMTYRDSSKPVFE